MNDKKKTGVIVRPTPIAVNPNKTKTTAGVPSGTMTPIIIKPGKTKGGKGK